MHMADALISPAVGGTMWAASAGLIAWCSRQVRRTLRDSLVPMMGVLGAFVFAAQMINFSIPGTGSSGHLGGGLLLAVLLGPHAAFLTIASVLTVQAFFFADGGLLALGCNLFNLGFFPAFVAYPLVYRPLVRNRHGTPRATAAAVAAAVAGLQLGAFGVVAETGASGIAALPFGALLWVMLPIHLAIGIVEGLATAAVVSFLARARPEALSSAPAALAPRHMRPVLIGLASAAVIVAGVFSWFASTRPDGLEWSIARVAGGQEAPEPGTGVRGELARLQEKTALLPDYGFRTGATSVAPGAKPAADSWPAVKAATSVSGLVGGFLTLAMTGAAGLALRATSIRRARRNG
jgi:cobalt/nickel transport system permease protein